MKNDKKLLNEVEKIQRLIEFLTEAETETSKGPTLLQKLAKLVGALAKLDLEDDVASIIGTKISKGEMKGVTMAGKTITNIDWAQLTDDELQILFKSKIFKSNVESYIGKDVLTRKTNTGNVKKIADAYQKSSVSPVSPPLPPPARKIRKDIETNDPDFNNTLLKELEKEVNNNPQLKDFFDKIFKKNASEVQSALNQAKKSAISKIDSSTDDEIIKIIVTNVVPSLHAITTKQSTYRKLLNGFNQFKIDHPSAFKYVRNIAILALILGYLQKKYGWTTSISDLVNMFKSGTGYFDDDEIPGDNNVDKVKKLIDSLANNQKPVIIPGKGNINQDSIEFKKWLDAQ